ncbi:hexose transporter [Moniliophthora roreri]|nr:hexose transporter [Moniliophthora roreri]
MNADIQNFSGWNNNIHPCWYKDPGLRKNRARVALLYLGVFTLGYDGSLLNCLQVLPQWNEYFDRPSGSTLGLIAASLYFSMIVSVYASVRVIGI